MKGKSYKIVIEGVERNITADADRTTMEDIFKKYQADSFILRTVGEICEQSDAFYIANYQRGYRWGKAEVEALLDDIYDVYKKGENERVQNYCLQQLIVKKRDDQLKYLQTLGDLKERGANERFMEGEFYELLDGQQRLTTLWLILSELDHHERRYHIYYELLRSVDGDFIKQAGKTIQEWMDRAVHPFDSGPKLFQVYQKQLLCLFG